MSRYRDYGERADLAICRDCTTRTSLVVIDRDEIPEHDQLHAEHDPHGHLEGRQD